MPAVDRHTNMVPSLLGSLRFAEAVGAGNDAAELANVCNAITVAEVGDVHAITSEDDEITFFVGVAGWPFPVRLKKIFETGTTATGIVAWDN